MHIHTYIYIYIYMCTCACTDSSGGIDPKPILLLGGELL